jgi:hypothetical protein
MLDGPCKLGRSSGSTWPPGANPSTTAFWSTWTKTSAPGRADKRRPRRDHRHSCVLVLEGQLHEVALAPGGQPKWRVLVPGDKLDAYTHSEPRPGQSRTPAFWSGQGRGQRRGQGGRQAVKG